MQIVSGEVFPKINLSAQKQFIGEKIISLGSVDAVEKFYSLDDAVSKYAKSIAPIVLSHERAKKKSKDMKAALMKSDAGGVVDTIKQKIRELKSIVKSSGEITVNRISLAETLEELRNLFRNSRNPFSSSDIERIQSLKERFEKAYRITIESE